LPSRRTGKRSVIVAGASDRTKHGRVAGADFRWPSSPKIGTALLER
jgi:hypothetical protein